MKLLALDFDGVISDSAPEAWMVALRTWADLRPDPVVIALRDAAERATPAEIRTNPQYRAFVDMMPLGNNAADFAVALGLVAGDRRAADQAAFDRAFEEAGEAFLSRFYDRFYATRAAFRAGEPDRWVSLLGPYPEFIALLRRLHERARDVPLAIATAKDRPSVLRLVEAYGIADLFGEDALVDKEAGRSKRAHLTALHERFSVSFAQIVFVDDKVSHLDDVAPLGVQGVLAAWGYNGDREQRQARERGYRVCSIEDFELQLFG